ncbi:hypothetical protein M0811_10396 [Anaeramoeba ignava]|uniref:purine-nucleoside phosphorylase n=1 Tax=Anaeramoeba ignava TaxID=1746090 RepID=A0A9Q0R8S4_ANAIG|nr:hypothetical protein M0811_10396 [Anaeramoeba ignava]
MIERIKISEYNQKLLSAVNIIKERIGEGDIGMVLGSGLGSLADTIENVKEIPYSEIPGMPQTSVSSHKGCLIGGKLKGKNVLCLSGRVHEYEGYSDHELTYGIRLLGLCGCKILIITNAAGGCGEGMEPGSIMAITDHIFPSKTNLLTDSFIDPILGEELPNLSDVYSSRLLNIARGTYLLSPGPAFETAEEVQSGIRGGATAFGMSTIVEVLAAKKLGMEVFGFSHISNIAAGISKKKLKHEDITEQIETSGPRMCKFVKEFVSRITFLEQEKEKFEEKKLDMKYENIYIPPYYKPPPPKYEHIREAGDYIRKKILALPKVCLFVSCYHEMENIESHFSIQQTISLKKIPFMPIISPSAHFAHLFFGHTRKNRVPGCLVFSKDFRGFYEGELSFLVLLFRELGVNFMIQTFIASGINQNENQEQKDVMIIDDIVNYHLTGIQCNDNEINQKVKKTAFVLNNDLKSQFEKIANNDKLNIFRGVFSTGMTPMYLTNNGFKFQSVSGVDAFGMESLDGFLTARNFDVKFLGIANVVYYQKDIKIVTEKLISQNAHKSASKFMKCLIDMIDSQVETNLPEKQSFVEQKTQIPLDNQEKTPKKEAKKSLLATEFPPEPIYDQGVYGHVEKIKSTLSKLLNGLKIELAILIENGVEEFKNVLTLKNFKRTKTIPLSEIANLVSPDYKLEDDFHDDNNGFVVFGEFLNVGVMLIYPGSNEPHSKTSIHDVVIVLRLAHLFSVKSLFLLCELCSVNPELQIGDFVLVKDHTNFSGISPIRGLHDEKWGPMFCDMTTTYSNKSMIEIMNKLKIPVKEVNAMISVDPIYSSVALATPAKNLCGADVISAGQLYQTITITQMEMKAIALGIIHTKIDTEKRVIENLESFEQKNKIEANLREIIEGYIRNRSFQESNFEKIINYTIGATILVSAGIAIRNNLRK